MTSVSPRQVISAPWHDCTTRITERSQFLGQLHTRIQVYRDARDLARPDTGALIVVGQSDQRPVDDRHRSSHGLGTARGHGDGLRTKGSPPIRGLSNVARHRRLELRGTLYVSQLPGCSSLPKVSREVSIYGG